MSANSTFQVVNEHGWRRGFANMLRKENRDWWRTRRWWINILIWLVLINGVVFGMLSSSDGGNRPSPEQAVTNAEVNFAGFAGFFGAMGVVIIMQGVIIDEKKSGTAAWIASKPVSRTSFILSKLIANTAAILIVIYVVQGVLVYLQFALLGSTPPLGPYVFSLALLGLHLLFYLTLTLMLGTLFNERGPVIGIPLAILFASQFLMSQLGSLVQFTPWPIVKDPALAVQAIMGQPLDSVTPIVATAVWSVVFVAVAIWRYQREEF